MVSPLDCSSFVALLPTAPATAIVRMSPEFVANASSPNPSESVRTNVPLASNLFLVLRFMSLIIRESPTPIALVNCTAPERSTCDILSVAVKLADAARRLEPAKRTFSVVFTAPDSIRIPPLKPTFDDDPEPTTTPTL